MAKKVTKLTALEVGNLVKRRAPGRHLVSENLYLQVKESGRASWLYRYMIDSRLIERNGKIVRVGAHWAGLGRYPRVDLADARARASQYADQLGRGIDPLTAKRQAIREQRIEAAKTITFAECARQYLHAQENGWKSSKHAAQWRTTFAGSTRAPAATAAINDLPVGEIDIRLALRVLQPIWNKIPETANRVRGRCEMVLDWASAHSYRDDGKNPNPFRWRGHLKNLLPPPRKLKALKGSGHHTALPYPDLPQFMRELREQDSASARALEFAILTAARTSEVIGACWREIDRKEKVWTVPALRMKAGQEHKVPLSPRALAVLGEPQEFDDWVFRLSDRAMWELLHALRPGHTVHGFRATFRTWAGERTNFAHHVCEAALAHTIPDLVVRSYARTTFFDQRRELMNRWAEFCASRPAGRDTGNVTPLRRGSEVS
jgi:integrase